MFRWPFGKNKKQETVVVKRPVVDEDLLEVAVWAVTLDKVNDLSANCCSQRDEDVAPEENNADGELEMTKSVYSNSLLTEENSSDDFDIGGSGDFDSCDDSVVMIFT